MDLRTVEKLVQEFTNNGETELFNELYNDFILNYTEDINEYDRLKMVVKIIDEDTFVDKSESLINKIIVDTKLALFNKDYNIVYHNTFDENGDIKDTDLYYDDKEIGCIVKYIKTDYVFVVKNRDWGYLYDELDNKFYVDDCIPSNNIELR